MEVSRKQRPAPAGLEEREAPVKGEPGEEGRRLQGGEVLLVGGPGRVHGVALAKRQERRRKRRRKMGWKENERRMKKREDWGRVKKKGDGGWWRRGGDDWGEKREEIAKQKEEEFVLFFFVGKRRRENPRKSELGHLMAAPHFFLFFSLPPLTQKTGGESSQHDDGIHQDLIEILSNFFSDFFSPFFFSFLVNYDIQKKKRRKIEIRSPKWWWDDARNSQIIKGEIMRRRKKKKKTDLLWGERAPFGFLPFFSFSLWASQLAVCWDSQEKKTTQQQKMKEDKNTTQNKSTRGGRTPTNLHQNHHHHHHHHSKSSFFFFFFFSCCFLERFKLILSSCVRLISNCGRRRLWLSRLWGPRCLRCSPPSGITSTQRSTSPPWDARSRSHSPHHLFLCHFPQLFSSFWCLVFLSCAYLWF